MGTENRSIALLRRVALWASRKLAMIFLISIGLLAGFWLRGFSVSNAPLPPGESEIAVQSVKEATVWTCSMHPQIQLPSSGLCPICNMDLIPLREEETSDVAGMRVFTTSETAKALMGVQTSEVIHRFVEKEVRMVGKVDFDETNLAYITSWVPGRIDELFVDYTGVTVNKGDHMVYLYSPELLTAQDELRRAAQAAKKMHSNAPDILKQTTQSTLNATREKLRRWGLTDSQIRAAETASKASDHITIYAPIGGTVIHRNGQEGMYVQTGTRIYTIADLKSVWVKLEAYESDLPWIHYGQTVTFRSESYPGEVFEGKIAFIDPVLDKKTRTVKVRVNVANPEGKLKPEMFIRAFVRSQVATGGRVMDPGISGKWISPMHPEIIKDEPGACDVCGMDLVKAEDLGYVAAVVSDEDKPLVIPASAPLITGTRAIVYVEVPNTEKPTFEGREIVLGARAGAYYIVKSGLAAGEYVVTNGNFKIDSALQILAKPSMMTSGGGSTAKKTDAPQAAEVTLTFAAKEELNKLGVAYQGVMRATESDDTEGTGTAIADFIAVLDAVNKDEFTGHAHMIWMEYALRLKNDAVELQGEQFPDRRRALTTTLRRNSRDLFSQLGQPMPGHSGDAGVAGQVSEAFQQQIGKVYEGYLVLQVALAADSLAQAVEGATQMKAALTAVEMQLVAGDAHRDWMSLTSVLEKSLDAAVKADSIASVRAVLSPLSEALWSAVRAFGIQSDYAVYQAHCSMALDGQGANWLQSDMEIRNPYYGASMLMCGDIVAKLGTVASALKDETAHAEGADHK